MKPFEDIGHAVAAQKPLKLVRREPGRLPDPGQCVDGLVVENDRSDGTPRGRVAVSNGASWDHLAYRHEVEDLAKKFDEFRKRALATVPHVDLAELAREQVALAARHLPQPQPIAHQAQALPQLAGDDLTALREADRSTAEAILCLSEHVNRLLMENAEIRAELEAIKRIPIVSDIRLTGAA
jgi:hypothetical protein